MSMELPFSLDDQYVVLRQIKAGGFGIVYGGWDENLNLPIAIKEIHPQLLTEESALVAFQAEAQLIARLDHPGICRVYTLKRYRGRLFMIMEFIDGGDLRNLQSFLKTQGTALTPALVLYMIRQVGKALHYAHLRMDPSTGAPLKLVHRDIAPSNFMISRMGDVKLIDFGIARVKGVVRPETMGGVIKGRPQYMSPEQIYSPDTLDSRSDIYSLAVILLDLLTGHSVYGKTTNEYELMDRVRARRFDLDAYFAENELPVELRPAVDGALQLDVHRRTATARAFIDQLAPYREAIGYNEEQVHAELTRVAQTAFPPANLQAEIQHFRATRDSEPTMTISLPRPAPLPPLPGDSASQAWTPPPRGVTPAAPPPPPVATAHPEAKREARSRTNWTPWILGLVVLTAAGIGGWALFIRPQQLAEEAFRQASIRKADSLLAVQHARDSLNALAKQLAVTDTAGNVEPAQTEATPTPQAPTTPSKPAENATRPSPKVEPSEKPVLVKPEFAESQRKEQAPPPAKNPGAFGIQVNRRATLFIDGQETAQLEAGMPYWDQRTGTHSVRIEAVGKSGCSLIKELSITSPRNDVKVITLVTGFIKIDGALPPNTEARITASSADIQVAPRCQTLTRPGTYEYLAGTYEWELVKNGTTHERRQLVVQSGGTITVGIQ